jgi:hypothetical protein
MRVACVIVAAASACSLETLPVRFLIPSLRDGDQVYAGSILSLTCPHSYQLFAKGCDYYLPKTDECIQCQAPDPNVEHCWYDEWHERCMCEYHNCWENGNCLDWSQGPPPPRTDAESRCSVADENCDDGYCTCTYERHLDLWAVVHGQHSGLIPPKLDCGNAPWVTEAGRRLMESDPLADIAERPIVRLPSTPDAVFMFLRAIATYGYENENQLHNFVYRTWRRSQANFLIFSEVTTNGRIDKIGPTAEEFTSMCEFDPLLLARFPPRSPFAAAFANFSCALVHMHCPGK